MEDIKIFISYRRKDSGREVGRIRDRLMLEFGEHSVFRDLVDIDPGRDFRTVLEHETNNCHVMLVVIGPLWAGITDDQGNKRLFDPGDYTRKEVETGLERLPTGDVVVIPILVMNAMMPSPTEIPDSLCQLCNQNALSVHDDPYFEFDMGRLITTIKGSSVYQNLDIAKEKFEPRTIYIPAGPFWMGWPPDKDIPAYESPQHEVKLPAYRIGECPVTNREYAEFLRKNQLLAPRALGWDGQKIPKGYEEYPMTGATWFEAQAYCEWLSGVTGRLYSLPNEAQWEKACRGGMTSLYPWGREFDPARCNQGQLVLAAVKKYLPQNDYGLYDLVGNIRQWTCSLWGEERAAPDPAFVYPWQDDDRNDVHANGQIRRILRGSSFNSDPKYLRCSARMGQLPNSSNGYGFRVVRTVE